MNNKSFTLIELLVVIVIIGILAGVIMISTSSSIDKASIAKIKVFEESVLNNLSANMVSRWKLNGDANDAWGSNHGTLTNFNFDANSGWLGESNCISGDCLKFDGVNDYVNIRDSLSLDIYSEVTFSLWIKRTDIGTGYQGILTKESIGGYALVLNYSTTEQKITYVGPGISTKTTSAAFNDYGWHNFVCTINEGSNSLKFYLDGILDSSHVTVGILGATTSILTIGSRGTGYFKGILDDIKIYGEALSLSEIKKEYVAGLDSMLASKSISKGNYNKKIKELSSK